MPTLLWGAILIISRQYGQKLFQSSFDDFSGPGTTRGGKVENRPHMTRFTGRNIPTLFWGAILIVSHEYG